MRVYIISDCHFTYNPKTTEEQGRNRVVLDFISSLIGQAEMLILAGDIFDLWYDWRSVIIKGYFPLLKKLADLKESNCNLVFISGNHDFWFGNFLKEYLECKIYNDHYCSIIDSKRLFVSHGDQFTNNDFRHRVFKKLIRNPISRFLFSILHPNISLSVGMLFSRTSRIISSQPTKSELIRTCGLEHYSKKIAADYDIIVMGHSHNPKFKLIDNTIFINTGYWGQDNSYVRIIDGEAQLLNYKNL